MLNGVRLKSLYSKIQREIFYMIPENWEEIYLYAAVVENQDKKERGEMFFYYYPKSILKKNPVNVYEIPSKFNIDEDEYMKLVNNLYDSIKALREEFKISNDKVWTNLTISIKNSKFHVEYDYEDLNKSRYSDEDRRIIWQYKYLGLTEERLSEKDRKMLEKYLFDEQFKNRDTKEHSENIYQKNIHNIVEYNKQGNNDIEEDIVIKKKENIEFDKELTKKYDKYELYKMKKNGIPIPKDKDEKKPTKNQILNV